MKNRTKDIRACRRKRKYSWKEAQIRALRQNAKGEYLHAYECPVCGGWHVGHPLKRVRLEMAFDRIREARV